MREAVEREESNSEQRLTVQTEKMLDSLKEEIDQNYKKYGEFIGEHMSRIEETQEVLNGALADKDSLVQGLKKTSQDLGTISEASGKLVDRFAKLSKELDRQPDQGCQKTRQPVPGRSAGPRKTSCLTRWKS